MSITMNGIQYISTKEAAKQLRVTMGWITQLINDGRLEGQKVGRDWVVSRTSLEAFKPKKAGRPRSGSTRANGRVS